jgi:hypothetical protein
MKLFGYIQPLYFFTAFAVGMLFAYVLTPPPQIVVKFPTPYNSDKVVYRDQTDTCYKYLAEQVSCPLDKSVIKSQPII